MPCDAETIAALAGEVDQANGAGVDPKNAEAQIKTAKARLMGKEHAFTGCRYTGHADDEVSFSAAGTEAELTCKMKDGEDAVRNLVRIAENEDALDLDVRGVIGMGGAPSHRLQMTECEISVN